MDTREAVARAMLAEMERKGDFEGWVDKLSAFPERMLDDLATAAIVAHLKALADAGMVVVPKEPTEAMVAAAYAYDAADKTYDSRYGSDFGAVYRTMIQAVDNG